MKEQQKYRIKDRSFIMGKQQRKILQMNIFKLQRRNKDKKILETTKLLDQKQITNEKILEIFTQENLAYLMEDKKVHGIILTKEQRREIKHNFKRGIKHFR